VDLLGRVGAAEWHDGGQGRERCGRCGGRAVGGRRRRDWVCKPVDRIRVFVFFISIVC